MTPRPNKAGRPNKTGIEWKDKAVRRFYNAGYSKARRAAGIKKHVNPAGTTICSTFACGSALSLVESLAGTRCTACMGRGKVDVNKYLSV